VILAFFDLVNANVLSRFAAQGLPALVDGAVLLGPENSPIQKTTASPRITLVPLGGSLTKRAPGTPVPTSGPLYEASVTQPWIYTDVQQWRADVSGVQYVTGAAESDLRENWDWTSAMLYVLIQAITDLAEGSWKPIRYDWVDSQRGSTGLGGFGRQIAFYFEVLAPVLTYNLPTPVPLAQPGLGLLPGSSTGTISITAGSASDAITINVP
jgi:hypothetical protein